MQSRRSTVGPFSEGTSFEEGAVRIPAFGIALFAGGLSVVNPCGFALLPAFLSLYVGADERDLPPASSRVVQGLLVGATVSGGFFAVFSLVGLPLIFGASRLTDAFPWAGLAIGVALFLVGLGLLAGARIPLSVPNPVTVRRDRRVRTMVLFGAGYGIASLGCTLPVFLATIGASLATAGGTSALAVFLAYGMGMTVVIMALALTAAFVRSGLHRALKRLLPRMNRVAGALLAIAGGYLAYYWARVLFGSAATLADDPLVGPVERFIAGIQRTASSGGGRSFVIVAFALVAVGVVLAVWRWTGRAESEN